jgi:hypothetical protein
MPSTQSAKPRASLRKAPPAKIPKAPASKASAPDPAKVAVPKSGKAVVARKSTGPAIGSMEWRQSVATAAYLRAEARGFVGGSPEQDWFEAEAQMMAIQSPVSL